MTLRSRTAAIDHPTSLAMPPPLAEIRRPALFLDFDGTLVEMAARPDEVAVGGVLTDLLTAVARLLDGRLAIVSGRSIAQLDTFFGPLGAMLGFSGSHGAELRWQTLPISAPAVRPELEQIFDALLAFADDHPGVVVERKSHGAAVHYRLAPESGPAAVALVHRLAEAHGFHVQGGKCIIELKSSSSNKGEAVRIFMERADFAGSTPIFIGDDLTDEAGFEAAADLGGCGILVGPHRATAAAWAIEDVAGVHGWMRAAVEAQA